MSGEAVEVTRGDTWWIEVEWLEGEVGNETPKDLTGLQLRSQFRSIKKPYGLALELPAAGAFIDNGLAQGKVVLRVDPEHTKMLDDDMLRLKCDVEATNTATGVVESTSTFYVTVEPDVTLPEA
jgi:hypothetical protein